MASSFSLADNGLINFGDDSEITLTHVQNVGLTLTNIKTTDDTPVVLQLKSEENEIVANEVIASIEFAAGDSDGTDGATVAAGIHAIAEGTFSATANETKLVFTTGVSETAASSADAKMTLSSLGNLNINGALTNTSGVLSFNDDIVVTRNDIQAKNIKTSHLNNNKWKQMGPDIDGEAGGDKSGYSVSLSANGKIVSIGAPINAGGGTQRGHVRIYEFNETTLTWSQKGSDIDGEADSDHSGLWESLSADGNTVCIGARYNDGGGGGSGHVRIYRWNGSSWAQIGSDIDGITNERFGYSNGLSANGNTFVAGGTYWNTSVHSDRYKGRVRVFDYDGSAWVKRGSDIIGDSVNDYEGRLVSISYDGNIIATGAMKADDDVDDNVGRVRIYYWNGSAWTQRGSDIYGEADDDESGFALSLSGDGNVIAIGDHRHSGGDMDGHARVFYWNGTAWTQRGINIEAEATDDKFGHHVELNADGNTLIVGGSANDGTTGTSSDNRGHVRIFRWDGVKWNQIGADIDGAAAGDAFGYQLGISADGNIIAIGALYHDGNRGHVQIYTLGEYINDLSAGVIKSIAYTGTPEGGGIDASDAVSISVGEFNSEIVTTLFVDIGAGSILSSSTAGDVIGNDGVANAYITRITTAVNGVVYKGEIICLEVPTTGDPDINVCANSSGTIAEDAAGEGEHVLANCGIHTLALRTEFTIPTDGIENDYIYLTHGGEVDGTYSAGKFLIRFYGAKATGL